MSSSPPGPADDAAASAIAANAVEFTDEQKASIRDAFFDAEMALLRAVAQQAENLGNFEAVRNITASVSALHGLRSMSFQTAQHLWAVSRGPSWFGYAPNTGGVFEPAFDDFDEFDDD